MGSNLTFQSRNVLSKFVMQSEDVKKMDYVSLLGVVTAVSAALAVPLALVFEGSSAPGAFRALSARGGIDAVVLAGKTLFYASVCFQLYQQLSFSVLERVSRLRIRSETRSSASSSSPPPSSSFATR